MKPHLCVVCRDLPLRPFDPADREPGVEYRPERPRKVVSGETKRSFRCATHDRAKAKATNGRGRAAHKARRFGLSPALQLALWVFQGSACACGRKAAPEPPPGITLHHDRVLARLHPHPDDEGCLDCVVAFLCVACNRDTVGRLERSFAGDPAVVAAALSTLAAFLTDPPLRRLLASRPDLKDTAA